MKKLSLILLLSLPLCSWSNQVGPTPNGIKTLKLAPVTQKDQVEEEADYEEEEESNGTTPDSTAAVVQKAEAKVTKQEEAAKQAAQEAQQKAQEAAQAAQELERTRRSADLGIRPKIDVMNKSGRPVQLYGQEAPNAPRQLLGTFELSKPAQTVTIPAGIQIISVESAGQSNQLPLLHGIQVVEIALASAVGSFTYTLSPLVPDYGEYILLYNATNNEQIIDLQIETTVPGFILGNKQANQDFSYVIPANSTHIITIPQFAAPVTQTDTATISLESNSQTITTNEHNTFVITQDNGVPTLHKI